MTPLIKTTLIGAGIGAIPGLFSALVGTFVTFLRADVGIQNATSLLVYLGILLGGCAGATVGAMMMTQSK